MQDNIWGFDADTVRTFDRAYFLSKPTQQQALYAGAEGQLGPDGRPVQPIDPFTRYALAVDLAKQGFIIDEDIDAHGGDPYITMFARKQLGNTWEPSAMMLPGEGPLVGPVPPGAIKVSIDLADYPPFNPPPPPPNPATSVLVGAVMFGNMYALTKAASDLFAAGQLPASTSQGGLNFMLRVNQFVIGQQVYWERI